MAQGPAQAGEGVVHRDRDDHAPDDRHQEWLGDREAPEGQDQEQPDADHDLGRGPGDRELLVFRPWWLHGTGSSAALVGRCRRTPTTVKALLRGDVVSGGA